MRMYFRFTQTSKHKHEKRGRNADSSRLAMTDGTPASKMRNPAIVAITHGDRPYREWAR